MSERTAYEPGTPSWADNASPDPRAAAGFYSALFGWETENRMPEGSEAEYHMATLRGKDVAAFGPQPMDGVPPVWNTYVTVTDADATAQTVVDAGGAVLMPPFDVLEAGRMGVFADPAGAVFMAWQPRGSIGAELVNEPNTLTWNELATNDVEGAKAFYATVFGWQPTSMDFAGGEYTIWNRGGTEPKMGTPEEGGTGLGGMLSLDAFPEGTPPFWLVYFAVADVDAVAAKAQELGGNVVMAPFDAEGVGRIAGLTDPQGAVFSVIALSN